MNEPERDPVTALVHAFDPTSINVVGASMFVILLFVGYFAH